jgi:hypothetical protein
MSNSNLTYTKVFNHEEATRFFGGRDEGKLAISVVCMTHADFHQHFPGKRLFYTMQNMVPVLDLEFPSIHTNHSS